jgi:hypothetical protein
MYPSVKEVIPIDNYQLLLTFDNGEKRQFDVKPYLNIGLFKELKNSSLFKTVRVNFDTVEWQNEIDIDPEVLYLDSIKIA